MWTNQASAAARAKPGIMPTKISDARNNIFISRFEIKWDNLSCSQVADEDGPATVRV